MTNFWGFIEKIKNFIKPTSTGVKMLESIQDKNGNPRFAEGTFNPFAVEGVTYTYKKWSLSGSHLMIVLAGTIAKNTEIATGSTLTDINIPSWIGEKIYPLFTDNVQAQTLTAWSSGYGTQTTPIYLNKQSNTKLRVFMSGLTLTAERNFRVQFDLLIDNE